MGICGTEKGVRRRHSSASSLPKSEAGGPGALAGSPALEVGLVVFLLPAAMFDKSSLQMDRRIILTHSQKVHHGREDMAAGP